MHRTYSETSSTNNSMRKQYIFKGKGILYQDVSVEVFFQFFIVIGATRLLYPRLPSSVFC